MLPELPAKVSLTRKRLTIHYQGKDKHFNLTNDCINLIEIDDWMNNQVIGKLDENIEFQKRLRDQYEKEQLRRKLAGE